MTYKEIDTILGTKSVDVKTSLERLWWSLVYVSDAYVELFNHIQLALIGKRSQWLSRAVAVASIVVPLLFLIIH